MMGEPAGQLRSVVLHHTGHGDAHFDVMIEPSRGAARLLTWRTPVWPLREGTPLTALGEHRRAYLEFEGPVSGGRGQVRRVAEGFCHLRDAGGRVVVQFDGESVGWVLADAARLLATYHPGE